jgi:cobalt-zinc-cadmium efflux system membrane fusion protein
MTRAVFVVPAMLLALACDRAPVPGHQEKVEPPGNRQVRLSEEALRAADLSLVAVSRTAFHPHILASGVIRPVAQKSVLVRALVAGRAVRVRADVGDRVGAGQILATIEGPEVTAALARHRIATSRRDAARQALERAERLVELKAISRAEVDLRRSEAEATAAEAEASRQELTRLGIDPDRPPQGDSGLPQFEILAPMPGVVLERSVSPGLLVERESPLFTIADLSQVWAVVDVYQQDLGQVREHGDVEVQTEAYSGTVFEGRIALIEPALDEASRTAHVRVLLDNRAGKLRPGLFVTAAIPLLGSSDVEALALPEDAVQKISRLPIVFVEKEPGLYEMRPVETGREAHGMVEILHGLSEGERVVARGAFLLKSELVKGSIGGEEH